MKKMLIVVMGSLILLISVAMDANSNSLSNRSGIEIGFGFRDYKGYQNQYNVYDILDHSSIENMTFSFGFNHWINERTAFNLSVSVIDVENRTAIDEIGLYDYNYAVVPIMAGFRFYMSHANDQSDFRPFISMGMGPVIRSSNYDYAGYHAYDNTYTETVFGVKIGGGVDVIMGKHMILGFEGSYNHYSDFDNQIGFDNVYNGPEFGIRFGFVFGGGSNAPEKSRGITRVHH